MTQPGAYPTRKQAGARAPKAAGKLGWLRRSLRVADETERKTMWEKTNDAVLKFVVTSPFRLVAAATPFTGAGPAATVSALGIATVADIGVNVWRSRKKGKAAAAKKADQVEKGLDPDKDPLEQLQEARQEIVELREMVTGLSTQVAELRGKQIDDAQKLSYTNQTAVRADRKSDASLEQVSAVRTSLQGVAAQQNQFTPAVQAMIDEAVTRAVAQTNETWQRGLAGQVGVRFEGVESRLNQLETGQLVQQTVPSQPPLPEQPQPAKKQGWLDRLRGRTPEPAPVQQRQPQQQREPMPVYPGEDSQAGMPAPSWQGFHGAEPRPSGQQTSQPGEAPRLGQGPLASPQNVSKPGTGPKIR